MNSKAAVDESQVSCKLGLQKLCPLACSSRCTFPQVTPGAKAESPSTGPDLPDKKSSFQGPFEKRIDFRVDARSTCQICYTQAVFGYSELHCYETYIWAHIMFCGLRKESG